MSINDAQAQNRKVNRACYMVSTTPDGQIMLDALRRQFYGSPIKRTPDGYIDPNAVLVANGSRHVIETLEEWIEHGELAR